jgi:hypothetical protein
MKNITLSRDTVTQWLEDLEYSDSDKNVIAAIKQALAAPVQEPVPDYAWPTVADYEKDVGFEVNDAFKMAWAMARTTNALFTQLEKP